MIFFPKKDIIAIDIGSSSVKLLELQEIKNGYQLKNVGIGFLPPGTIVDGALKDQSAVTNIIKNLVSNLDIKTKNVATSISGHSVIIKNISLPVMSENELEESIKWEAEQYIPFEIDDVNIDFQILGENPEDKTQMNVLLVAAKQDIINDYIKVIKEAGLNAVVMDVDSFALENMFEINYPYNEGEVIALVDIGASILNMTILKNGMSVFTRDISIGGNKITAEIQKRKDISYEEAELLKIGGQVKEIDYREIEDVVTEASLSLATEIQRSMDFFWATFADERINKIYLSGGCSKSIELKRLIEDRVADIPVEVVNPFAGIDFSEKAFDSEYLEYIAPLMAVGVGLALRRAGDK
ncbi:MAG: type IV pilus assembly protein PilM [Thermodesulfobacteriota bacterium]